LSGDPLARGADETILGIPRELALPEGPWNGFRRFASPAEALAEITRLDLAA